ncbi:hypothetical protein E4T42_02283 [Aureobasidium subglaciale]|nr:hypothetical protein E4T38_06017 [Aureobasidium subglaciale]KAI5220062.1 hypothetical protein E4T40_06038 [Aureobasidium subglaciale]KAI5224013.1 hypothetical protein E4T41_05878 [Aureobasidium subglaciale]KAI5254527.1 hypothetical protein E4T42_02283 [Aureobasidium subglaciale]KAI5260614.1 hypothetical protein E4T46_05772 [Aureobasidium subglaciale]
MLSLPIILSFATSLAAAAGLNDASLKNYVNSLDLDYSFNPVKAAYWTDLPHHRRTPFALSPDGTRAFLAYLDDSETDVHVQRVDPKTFAAVGIAVTVKGGKEAGGLVAHNDGFALLTNEALPSGTTNAPADSTPVPVLYRYTEGEQTFKTFLGGPGVHESDGLSASPDLNGDLVYSEKAGIYGAYFVVTDYSGWAEGHFGDSVQYVSTNGSLDALPESSAWGCSHNTGIAFEAADAAPFASICAEDQGDIWLNTNNRGMDLSGTKISNENTTNGAGGESMGGMSGSYSNLARYQDEDSYIFSWVSRGAVDLYENSWMGKGYVASANRTNGRNVAIATFSDKQTMDGEQASSIVGAKDGDSQVNWITTGTADCSNAHVATFDGANALVTWEQIDEPQCDFIAMGCQGEYSGSYFQLVNKGEKIGAPVKSMDTYVAGDMVTMTDGRICWPYVNMTWRLDQPAGAYGGLPSSTTKQISFACISVGDAANASSSSVVSSSAVASGTVVASKIVANTAAISTSSSTAPSKIPISSPVVISSTAISASISSAKIAKVAHSTQLYSLSLVSLASASATTFSTATRVSSTSSVAAEENSTAVADTAKSQSENCQVQYIYE